MACTSPSSALTGWAGGKVNVRQRTSALSIRGYAIGRWPRFGNTLPCWDTVHATRYLLFILRSKAPRP